MRFKQRLLKVLLLNWLAILMSAAFATTNPMEKWEPWVLDDHPEHRCPWEMRADGGKSCIWPGRLTLHVNATGATFTYRVDVYKKEAFIALPGNTEHWPSAITVENNPAPVVERNKLPYVALSPGHYQIAGSFQWDKRPGQLRIPPDPAIVSLLIDGKNQPVDRHDGQLVFADKSANGQKKANDSLSIEVYRLLKDGVPVTLDTHITLSVSGKAREVTFGKVMLAGTLLEEIQSPIPARIEADGSIRAQVTPGRHTIRVRSRFITSPNSITTEKLTKEWPEFEYISFKSATAIRQAKLSGPVSVDTTQIAIPQAWRAYPTYRMRDNEPLTIKTEFRGDYSPGANELYVKRNCGWISMVKASLHWIV